MFITRRHHLGLAAAIAGMLMLDIAQAGDNLGPTVPSASTTRSKPPISGTSKTWRESVTDIEFAWIPKGCFRMGSPSSELGHRDNERQRHACVDGFWLSKYEVTNAQYRLLQSHHDSRSHFDNSLNNDIQPAVNIDWNEAVAYAEWLSSKTGQIYRLPTEAEWEYAARAGTTTAFYWGDDETEACRYANLRDRIGVSIFRWPGGGVDCNDGYHDVSAPVGRFVPNSYGLHDMLGNVYEWTASIYDETNSEGEKHIAHVGEGGFRVMRGGGWNSDPKFARSASRHWDAADASSGVVGFRLVRNP